MPADAWVAATAPRMETFTATQHMITDQVISFDGGDRATCVAYVRARHHLPSALGDSDRTVYGCYTNRFVRTPGGWRISGLKPTPVWMTGDFGVFPSALAAEGAPSAGAA